MFPFINLFCMFFSLWCAFTPRLRTADVKGNWWFFRLNLGAAAINAAGILVWVFNWAST